MNAADHLGTPSSRYINWAWAHVWGHVSVSAYACLYLVSCAFPCLCLCPFLSAHILDHIGISVWI